MDKQAFIVCIERPGGDIEHIQVDAWTELGAKNLAWLDHQDAIVHWAEPKVETHVHVYTCSRDCDGKYEYEHTVALPTFADNYAGADYSERERLGFFVGREVGRLLAFRIEFSITDSGDEIAIERPSDEGGSVIVYNVCDDELCEMHAKHQTLQRDHTAEAAGY